MHADGQQVELRGGRGNAPAGSLVREGDSPSAFRDEIVFSWQRCQVLGVAPTAHDVPYRPEFERPNRLLRAAGPVIDRLSEQLADGPVSILLADSEAQIIDRRAGERKLTNALDGASVAPGFHYAEEYTGTNGIGSALEERKPFQVSGAEHFRENLREFTCTGAPLLHPISGSVEGVLDVTGRVHETQDLMRPLVLAAREIESRLYADASRREQLLLQHFLRASRHATAVLTLNEDVVMANTAASALLDLSDQAMLWEWACRMLDTRDEHTGEVHLAHDTVVQAKATKIGDDVGAAGVLVEMRQRNGATREARPPRTRTRQPNPPQAEQRLPGRSLASQRLRDDVDAALQAHDPLLICGEPGVGKTFVANHLHQRRGCEQTLTVLDARTASDDHSAWIARLDNGLAGSGTVLVRHLDEIAPELAPRVEGIIEAAPTAQIIATARSRDERTVVGRTLDHFPVSLTVPPLRYRNEDIADIAPLLLAAHNTNQPTPRLRPNTLRTLTKLDWPGNIRELQAILTTAVTRSLGSDISHEHLPPEYRSTNNRTGDSSLQRAERDIVMEALAETRGNKLAAAERLGIARSTLYRKMRVLGINTSHLSRSS